MSTSDDRHDVPPPVPEEAFRRTERDEPHDGLDDRAVELVEGGIGLARLAIGSALRTSRWGLSTSMDIAERVVGSIAAGDSVTQAANQAATGARDALLELAGVADPEALHGAEPRRDRRRHESNVDELRRRGAELLRRSSDVNDDEETHPAYARILESLSPDEARILRLLALEGPQPSVDVRSVSAVPNNSELLEAGLTMIGELAGCKHVDRTKQYLNNCSRLGLLSLSDEPLREPGAYQVLEAQPDVLEAMGRSKRARTVRRSIRMTPFGHDFVGICLLPEADAD